MATRQITSSWLNQPEAVHAGVNALVLHISLSTTWSSTDVLQIGKLPVNAIPLDAVFYGQASAVVAKFGTSASPSAFFASASYSIARYQTTKTLGLKAQCSLSDDKMPRYVPVTMAGTGTNATLGLIGDLVIYYKMPGQSFP
jgi:hypothetical protein